jgi:hypothetical protein
MKCRGDLGELRFPDPAPDDEELKRRDCGARDGAQSRVEELVA